MTSNGWKKFFRDRKQNGRCNCISCLRSEGFTPPYTNRHRSITLAMAAFGKLPTDELVARVWPDRIGATENLHLDDDSED